MSTRQGLLFFFLALAMTAASYALDKSVFGGDQMTIELPAMTGQVEMVVEQSDDLVNWTSVAPGSFQASTQKRFFRLRAVEK